MKKIIFFLLTAANLTAFAGDPKFPVRQIPAEMSLNCDVVIRRDEATFKIVSKRKASYHVYFVATIYNERGKRYATEVIGYDKLSKVTMFEGKSYDAEGNLIKRVKNSEIYDQSAYDGFSLYSDNRIKAAEIIHGSYPYTVEFEYEIEYKYLFFIPGFVLIPGERISVQKSSYELIYPTDLRPRYKTFNIDKQPKVTAVSDGEESTKWEFENLKQIKFESMGPPREEIVSTIMAAPSTFEYDGYFGTMNSWDQFGLWIQSLNKGRDVLPEATKQEIIKLAATKNTQEEKIKAVYEYMQNKTRYVSIQLGIGGFQPFEASVVDETGYGDCKALSNYMVSMLEVIGVKSHYALIRAGRNAAGMKQDFPSSQFNHAVTAVPNGRDTIWLECTSQTAPFGYAGTFTGDREALIITETGAKIVKTTSYPGELNVQARVAEVYVQNTGDAKATVETKYSGLQYENDGLHFILNDQYDLQKKWVMKTTEIPNFDLTSYKFTNKKDKVPTATVELNLSLKKLASVSGKRLMLTPNLMNRSTFIPERTDGRITDIVENQAFVDYDTIRYHIPEEIYPEALPQPVKITSRFGEYESSYTLDQGLVVYTRKLKINKGRYPSSTYQEFTDFYKSINRADNSKLVFLNKT